MKRDSLIKLNNILVSLDRSDISDEEYNFVAQEIEDLIEMENPEMLEEFGFAENSDDKEDSYSNIAFAIAWYCDKCERPTNLMVLNRNNGYCDECLNSLSNNSSGTSIEA